jgi:hypothetical protein
MLYAYLTKQLDGVYKHSSLSSISVIYMPSTVLLLVTQDRLADESAVAARVAYLQRHKTIAVKVRC